MKQILTLLIAVTAFSTLHAQSREQTRDVILGGSKDNGSYGSRDRDVILGGDNRGQYPNYPNNGSYGSDRQYQIEQVNREYSAKINSIRNNRYLSNSEKEKTIRQLERDRQRKIEEIDRRYSGSYTRNNNSRYDDRHDNGKHKGWYKKNKNKNWKNGQNRDWDDD